MRSFILSCVVAMAFLGLLGWAAAPAQAQWVTSYYYPTYGTYAYPSSSYYYSPGYATYYSAPAYSYSYYTPGYTSYYYTPGYTTYYSAPVYPSYYGWGYPGRWGYWRWR